MGKKILYIVLGALVVFGLLFLLWSWLFGGPAKTPANTGTLGSAGNVSQTATGGTNNNNGEVPIGSNTNQTQTIPGSQNTSGSVTSGATGGANGGFSGGGTSVGGTASIGTGVGGATTALTSVSGVSWLGSPFNPAGINNVVGGSGGSVPNITVTTINTPGSGGTSLIAALAGTAIAGLFSCGILLTSAAPATALGPSTAPAATAGLAAATTGSVPSGVTLVSVVGGVPTSDLLTHNQNAGLGLISYSDYLVKNASLAQQSAKTGQGFLGCIANTIAKAALQQITTSVVNWINSGFNGSPSFVTNFQQFFANTADLAAGQFIQGSGLAFLCSPFQLQIKIALAQSYANRNAQSCTLTKVIGDVNKFMNGNFSQGGWGGLVSFTTVPTNNPYGAFAYAQAGLQTAQQNALANAKNNISPTGFLNLQKVTCGGISTINANGSNISLSSAAASQAAKSGTSCPQGCTCSITTPGGAIATALNNTENSPLNQLGIAGDIDQIISALTTQLLTRTLQNGLTSLSQPTTQTSTDIASQSAALALLNDMQSRTTFSQQLGGIYQGSIGDIESAQAGLSGLVNCWQNSSSPQAAANASTTAATLQSLTDQVTADNDAITQINSGIVELNQFESEVSDASSAADIAAITTDYNAAIAAGSFPSQTDVTTAQQNRTTLQSQLATTNQATQAGLTQCNAAH